MASETIIEYPCGCAAHQTTISTWLETCAEHRGVLRAALTQLAAAPSSAAPAEPPKAEEAFEAAPASYGAPAENVTAVSQELAEFALTLDLTSAEELLGIVNRLRDADKAASSGAAPLREREELRLLARTTAHKNYFRAVKLCSCDLCLRIEAALYQVAALASLSGTAQEPK